MNSIEQQFKEVLPAMIKEKEISMLGVTYHFATFEGMQKTMHETIEVNAVNKLDHFISLHKKYSRLKLVK